MISYHFTRDYFSSVAATLLAGDIGARVVTNSASYSIRVHILDGGTVMWSNATEVWAWTIIHPDGTTEAGSTESPADLDVAGVARMIALFDYSAPPEFPRWDLDEWTHPVPEENPA